MDRTPVDLEKEKMLREKGAVRMRAAMSGVVAKEKEFERGDTVVLQDPSTGKWTREATVEEAREGARSYTVVDDRGAIRLRSGRMMRRDDAACHVRDQGEQRQARGPLSSAGWPSRGRPGPGNPATMWRPGVQGHISDSMGGQWPDSVLG